ncbi:MAG: TonB-dependent receptor plug domain-containing protein [Bacteroidales bacterium]|nr:TonB-dependent receptor plug domain-containing protein [Bacteroidales bacterium]
MKGFKCLFSVIVAMLPYVVWAQSDSLHKDIDTVTVQGRGGRGQIIRRGDYQHTIAADGNYIEQVVKMQPGVSSVSELSSQYNVRGGSFDENLVYINGIEIYRPLFVRSGEQEGLSIVNSGLAGKVEFSSGGFGAEYGDKMSSVLDVAYRRPDKNTLSIAAGLMGGAVDGGVVSKNGKFSLVSGVRYRTSKYILNSLEKKGEYNPAYADFQLFSTFKISDRINLWTLGMVSSNKFSFIPESQTTSFGTMQDALQMNIYYAGYERDTYLSAMEAAAVEYSDRQSIKMTATAAVYALKENVGYDIAAAYLLSSLDRRMGQPDDSTAAVDIGVGESLSHARNMMRAHIATFKYSGVFFAASNKIGWGAQAVLYDVDAHVNEWQTMDSAGYFVNSDKSLAMWRYNDRTTALARPDFSSYLYDKYDFNFLNADISANVGVRACYSDFSQILSVSPRLTFLIVPKSLNNYNFRLSAGRYVQPLTFREIMNSDGTQLLTRDPQKSFHIVGGVYHDFKMWNRPFKITAEAYYKKLTDIVPYTVDNVKITYYSSQRADGYAAGADFKIYGEFVEGMDSWLSLSFLKTEEDIKNDGYGNIPRPDDRRLSSSLFFRDYFPRFDFLGMNLTLVYATPLPFGPENMPRYTAVYRSKQYLRADFGLEAALWREKLKPGKSIKIGVDIFNLFDIKNTVSYSWITVVPSQHSIADGENVQYAVPDRLTSRRINVKISIKL